MELIWKENFKVTSYQVDFQENIKPTNLMQLFQEAAGNHAQHLGAGYGALADENMFWALSRIRVELLKIPVWGEEIRIETWPNSLAGPFFRRDFLFFNQKDEMICRGVSGWLLLDAKNLRPQRADKLRVGLPFIAGKCALENFPDRLKGTTDQTVFRKKILYNEIDVNNHVNNTRYLDWVMDCFDFDFYRSHQLQSFTLEFLGEMHWGEEVELLLGHEGLSYHVQAINVQTKKVAFRADLNWLSSVNA